MRTIYYFALFVGVFAANSLAGTIFYQESPLGGNVFTYTYNTSGFTFQTNQELDIRFDPALYGVLSNPVAGPGYSAMVFQPNNPTGTFGDYSALALVTNPSFNGPFSVTVTYLGQGTPGSQPFYLNLYDQNLNFIGTTASGWTTPGAGPNAIPEPGSWTLAALGLLAGVVWAARSRKRCAAQ
jgi:hypothetical protein